MHESLVGEGERHWGEMGRFRKVDEEGVAGPLHPSRGPLPALGRALGEHSFPCLANSLDFSVDYGPQLSPVTNKASAMPPWLPDTSY